MTVETTELGNHLAEYLGKIRSTGESLTIVSEEKPVALLIPLSKAASSNGKTFIDRLLEKPLVIKDFVPLSRAEIYDAN